MLGVDNKILRCYNLYIIPIGLSYRPLMLFQGKARRNVGFHFI